MDFVYSPWMIAVFMLVFGLNACTGPTKPALYQAQGQLPRPKSGVQVRAFETHAQSLEDLMVGAVSAQMQLRKKNRELFAQFLAQPENVPFYPQVYEATMDSQCINLSEIFIKKMSLEGSRLIAETKTDDHGKFSLMLPEGRYVLIAEPVYFDFPSSLGEHEIEFTVLTGFADVWNYEAADRLARPDNKWKGLISAIFGNVDLTQICTRKIKSSP